MTEQDSTAAPRLLLGMSGWPHAEWEGRYFPADLPCDWQFAYYSNDADCLVLEPDQWQKLDPDALEDWLGDVGSDFRFFLKISGPFDEKGVERFAPNLGGLLMEEGQRIDLPWPQFCQDAEGYWVDPAGQPRVCLVPKLPETLRAQRTLLESLPPGLQALVVVDATADPGVLADMRRVAELLGIA